jgi:hypothetical protein
MEASQVKISCSREERAPRSRQGRVTRRFRGFWLVDRGFAVELHLAGAVSRRARRHFPRLRLPQTFFSEFWSPFHNFLQRLLYASTSTKGTFNSRWIVASSLHFALLSNGSSAVAGRVPNSRSRNPSLFNALWPPGNFCLASTRESVPVRNRPPLSIGISRETSNEISSRVRTPEIALRPRLPQ